MNDDRLETPFGSYQLERLPVQVNKPLRAWDAADEYLLTYLYDEQWIASGHRLLIINDSFGALSLSLRANPLCNWSDSYLAQQAYLNNLKYNHITAGEAELIRSTEIPSGTFDCVIIKVPRTMALLEDQLIKLNTLLHNNTRIIAAGMVKHLPKKAFTLFETILGKVTTSLAKKKSRLIFIQSEHKDKALQSPYPHNYKEKVTGLWLYNHANVFSREKLDIGTRLFLAQFKQLPHKASIVDLGCGNGILGIAVQQQQPHAKLYFCDESYMAIASAKMSYQHAFPHQSAEFIVSNGLGNLTNKVDLIVCNPPFHQQYSVSDLVAWQMFKSSKKQLNSMGELWVVGNRHLNYHSKLRKLFGCCDLIISKGKFVVLRAIKQ